MGLFTKKRCGCESGQRRLSQQFCLALNQRKKGGPGIYMVKNSMDDIFYAYKDGKNILTVKMKIH